MSNIEHELLRCRAHLESLKGRDALLCEMLKRAGWNPDKDGILDALRGLFAELHRLRVETKRLQAVIYAALDELSIPHPYNAVAILRCEAINTNDKPGPAPLSGEISDASNK